MNFIILNTITRVLPHFWELDVQATVRAVKQGRFTFKGIAVSDEDNSISVHRFCTSTLEDGTLLSNTDKQAKLVRHAYSLLRNLSALESNNPVPVSLSDFEDRAFAARERRMQAQRFSSGDETVFLYAEELDFAAHLDYGSSIRNIYCASYMHSLELANTYADSKLLPRLTVRMPRSAQNILCKNIALQADSVLPEEVRALRFNEQASFEVSLYYMKKELDLSLYKDLKSLYVNVLNSILENLIVPCALKSHIRLLDCESCKTIEVSPQMILEKGNTVTQIECCVGVEEMDIYSEQGRVEIEIMGINYKAFKFAQYRPNIMITNAREIRVKTDTPVNIVCKNCELDCLRFDYMSEKCNTPEDCDMPLCHVTGEGTKLLRDVTGSIIDYKLDNVTRA